MRLMRKRTVLYCTRKGDWFGGFCTGDLVGVGVYSLVLHVLYIV